MTRPGLAIGLTRHLLGGPEPPDRMSVDLNFKRLLILEVNKINCPLLLGAGTVLTFGSARLFLPQPVWEQE